MDRHYVALYRAYAVSDLEGDIDDNRESKREITVKAWYPSDT